MTPRPGLALPFALLLASLPVAAGARNWEHPDFASRRPESLVVLPPMASITRGKVNDAEPMIKETKALETAITNHVADVLHGLGYSVDTQALSEQALEDNRELRDAVQQVQSRVDELLPAISERPREIRNGRYSIGETGLPVAAATKAQGLIALRAQAIVPSKGTRAMSGVLSAVFGGIPYVPTTHTELIALVIDARTGLVQTALVGIEGGAVLKEPDHVGVRVVDAAFTAYPRRGQVVGTRKQKREAAQAASKPGATPPPAPGTLNETDVLSDFEKAASTMPTLTPAPGAAVPPPAEVVQPAASWTPAGPVALAQTDATPAAPQAAPAPPARSTPKAAGTATPAPSGAPAPVLATALLPGEDAAVRALYLAPAAQRPEPTLQPVIQVKDGGPALTIRNVSPHAVQASLDLGPWRRLETASELSSSVKAGSHWILVSDANGRELMRTSVMVSADGLTIVELWPL